MTHLSSYRYGEPMHEPPSETRGCSEVRISYFDPRTGEPCNEKPEPISIHREEGPTAIEHFEQRKKDVAEAAEIARSMKERNAKERKAKGGRGRAGRAVLVDGILFHSVTAAASEVGVDCGYLSKQLRAGAKLCHGRMVEYAEVDKKTDAKKHPWSEYRSVANMPGKPFKHFVQEGGAE